MSRIRELLPCALLLLLPGCNPPALDHLRPTSSTTDSSSSGTSSTSESTSVMTTTEDSDSGSGSASHAGSTTMTTPETSTGTTDDSDGTSTTTTSATPVCGDGVVEGEEECDDGNDVEDDRCHACAKNRWVFASAALHVEADFKGVEGADSLCRQYALQSGRADDSWMTFIAWLSDADHDVRDRMYPGRGRYVRTDGVVIAYSLEEFMSPVHAAPIDLDEHGQPAPGGVVTGTRPDGTAAPGTHCDNWTKTSGSDFSAYIGNTASKTEAWTFDPIPEINPTACVLYERLYCIEGE